jgi:hypothetical protein
MSWPEIAQAGESGKFTQVQAIPLEEPPGAQSSP